MSVTFRERMVGTVSAVDHAPRWIGPRGGHGGDGLLRLVSEQVAGARDTGRSTRVLDLHALTVTVSGLDRERDGYMAEVSAGLVSGVLGRPLDVVAGFADLLTISPEGRRMHYRLLAVDGPDHYVVEGVKTVTGGVRSAWRETTTLHTVVVRVAGGGTVPGTGTDRWLADGEFEGEVVLAGVLRVRGLLRQAASMRGPLVPFLAGSVRRAVRPRAAVDAWPRRRRR